MIQPTSLFKYLPSRYVDRVVRRGDLLFRNLSYFRKIEASGRGDLLEGLHRDYPDGPITIKAVNSGFEWRGRASFLNCINPDRVFVYCLSQLRSAELLQEFGCDACIEIRDVPEFLARSQKVIERQARFAEYGLLCGAARYYAPNRALDADVRDPRIIPFVKHETYAHQHEFRLVASLGGGLRVHQHIVNELYSFEEAALKGVEDHRHIFVGPIHDIVKVHHSA